MRDLFGCSSIAAGDEPDTGADKLAARATKAASADTAAAAGKFFTLCCGLPWVCLGYLQLTLLRGLHSAGLHCRSARIP